MGERNKFGLRKFRRLTDGVEGFGYWIEWSGIQQASVAWPDGASTRHPENDFELKKIEECVAAVEVNVMAVAESPSMPLDIDVPGEPLRISPESPTDHTLAVDVVPSAPPKQAIREYLESNPEAPNAQVVDHMGTIDVETTTTEVATVRSEVASDVTSEAGEAESEAASEPADESM